ncbi:ATP-binding protein [Miltoncostaea marina]|uniref:ATP-binding protein n=1 Tax=Miltoncostaea marina TaxID=2843215 RepID=UPI001C3CA78B|nr:ATP-binding protein [Miltoncostaea marina]
MPSRHDIRSTAIPATAAAPCAAREWIAAVGAGRLSARALQDAALVASELVTNAVRHAGLGYGAPIHLTLRFREPRLALSVADCGDGFAADGRDAAAVRAPATGRGLRIVRRLAERTEVDGVTGRVAVELSPA